MATDKKKTDEDYKMWGNHFADHRREAGFSNQTELEKRAGTSKGRVKKIESPSGAASFYRHLDEAQHFADAMGLHSIDDLIPDDERILDTVQCDTVGDVVNLLKEIAKRTPVRIVESEKSGILLRFDNSTDVGNAINDFLKKWNKSRESILEDRPTFLSKKRLTAVSDGVWNEGKKNITLLSGDLYLDGKIQEKREEFDELCEGMRKDVMNRAIDALHPTANREEKASNRPPARSRRSS